MFEPTKQQEKAIITRGSVLVTAAAGSGKTAVLVERVVEMLCREKNPASVDRLVIVTFTKAAAAEMRMRIEKRIIEKLKENPNDRHLSRQLMILPSARICTIDTFCIDLVRENFDAFSLTPDFKIGDGASLAPLYTEATDRVLEKYYATRQNETESLLRALNCTWGDSKLTDAILSVFEYSRNLPFPEQWLKRCKECYKNLDSDFFSQCRALALEEPHSALISAKEQLKNALEIIDENEKLATAYKEKLKDAYSLAERICESDRDTAFSLCKTAAVPVIYGHSGDGTAAVVRRARSAFLAATKNFAAAMDTDDLTAMQNLKAAAPFAVTLLEMTEDFADTLFSLMREKNTLTFYNTEQMALELLCDVSDCEYRMSQKALELCEGIDEILVDEYQDTNDLQDTLFYLLSDYGKKLFAVGDVKQSIYGFRGANPENFVRKKEEYIPLADAAVDDRKKIVLSSNFRSRKGICDFVNYFCSLVMSKKLGGVEYGEEEVLNSINSFPNSGFTDTEVHIISAADSDDTVELAEAKHIAAYIKNNVGKDTFLKDGKALRPARYSDFAILLRSPSTHSEVYMEELKKAGIPARFDVGGFITSVEVSTVLSLLKTINNPTQDVPLLACMMSPVFAFSADDVAEIRLYDRGTTLYGAVVTAANEGNEKAKILLERLRQYRRAAVTMSPERLVAYLYEETGLLDSVCAMDDGERRRKNLLLLLDYAKSYGNDGGDSRGFATYIEKIGVSVKTPAGNGGDAVNIVSFHGSKGLQYPVCIIAGCFRRFNDSDVKKNLLIDRTLGVAFKIADNANNCYINNVAREAIARTVKKRNLSEELRVMYVALTRAEERLVVLLSASNPAKHAADIAEKINSGNGDDVLFGTSGYFDWFLYALLKSKENQPLRDALGVKIGEEYLCDAECKIKTVLSAAETAENTEVTAEEINTESIDDEEIIKRFEYVYPFEALGTVKSKLSVSEIAHKRLAETNFTAQPAFLSKAGLTPAQRGTATHKFMQFADYFAAAEDLEKEKNRLVENGFMTTAEVVAVDTAELAKFFSCELFLRMSRCIELHREMRFLSEFSAKELYGADIESSEKTVVQGVIDCVIEEEDFITVLDFKTDRVKNGEQLKELYAAQLNIYAAACERIFSKPVKEKLLYSFCLGDVIKV